MKNIQFGTVLEANPSFPETGKKHKSGNLLEMLNYNQKRFNQSPKTYSLLKEFQSCFKF